MRTIASLTLLAALSLAGPARADEAETKAKAEALPAEPGTKPEARAEAAARAWLALTDSGEFGKSWDEASSLFKAAVKRDAWASAVRSVREPLGALKSRKLKSASVETSLPGAPDGEYVVLQFDTTFENKKDGVETVTPMREADGSFRVSGYFIK